MSRGISGERRPWRALLEGPGVAALPLTVGRIWLRGVISRGGSTTGDLRPQETKEAEGNVFSEVALSLVLGLNLNTGRLDATGIALSLLDAGWVDGRTWASPSTTIS